MKTGAEKSSSTTSATATREANRPFFAKKAGGDFFEPARPRLAAVQAKLAVNTPGDTFEREADQMAQKVMRMPAPPAAAQEEKLQRQPEKRLQKAAAPEEKLQRAASAQEKLEEKLAKAATPEERVQKAPAEEKLQKAAAPEERLQKAPLPDERVQKAAGADEKLRKKEEERKEKPSSGETIRRKETAGVPAVGPRTQSSIEGKGGGAPLPSEVRSYMEPRFAADFSNIRVHHDAQAASLSNELGARAFTYRNQVFFSRDSYHPGTDSGKALLAHELTHTIQQGHAVQRAPQVSTTATPPTVQRSAVGRFLDWVADKAYNIPGFRMFTIILGVNPINMESVDRSAANILRALIEFMPGGHLITQALDNHGVFNKIANWIDGKIKELGMVGSMFKDALMEFIDSLGWRDLAPWNWGDVWDRAKAIFTRPIKRLIDFAVGVVVDILKFVKDAILKPLAALAQGTRGYDLLKAILGEDPVTGEPYPRTADTLIGGFMKLIGKEEVWENIKKGKAIQRAWAWFQGALEGLMGFVRSIPRRIVDTIKSLTWSDILTVAGAFKKVVGCFVNIAVDFISWGLKQVLSLLEILFSVVAPGVMPYIAKARGAFSTILQNPVGFVGNLVRAGKQGFQMFADNFFDHLKEALITWIVGPLADAGVYIPKSFTLMEIIKLVLSVLGLTWQNIRTKLLKLIPEPVLVALEKTAGIVVTLVTEGPAAAWEQIKSELTELKDQLIEQVTQMVTTEVVKAAVKKVVMMLNPAGAVIQAIIAIYNTITFFIEKINQIGAVVGALIDSIAAIAVGQVMNAAKKVEATMARGLAMLISFLAKFAGIGDIPNKIVGVIGKVRAPIDIGLDKIVAWLGNMLKGAATALVQAGVSDDPEERAEHGMAAAVAAVNRFAGSEVGEEILSPLLSVIKVRYKFVTLEVVPEGDVWVVEGSQSPKKKGKTNAKNPIGVYKAILAALGLAAITEKNAKKYREKMRAAIVAKYKGDLVGLNTDVLVSSIIPSAQNRIRGDIFEQWLQDNGVIDKPSPIFISNNLYKKRIADGVKGSSLVDAKVRQSGTGPSPSDIEQMEDYSYIIAKGMKSVNKKVSYDGPFVQVIYIFNDKSVIPFWRKALQDNLSGRYTTK